MKSCEQDLVVASEPLIKDVLDAAFAVHTTIGPGLLESVYEAAILVELEERRIPAKSQVPIPVTYRGRDLGLAFRADLIVRNQLLVELKAVDHLTDVHLAQTMTYMKILQYKRGLLLNFNQHRLKDGLRRVSI